MTAALRFLFAQNTRDDRASGMGRWAHETAEALGRRGHQVTLWFADAFPHTVTRGRQAVVRFPAALGRRMVAERDRFDVAVVHEPAGRWYARRREDNPDLPPMILMCHNVEEHAFRQLRVAARQGCAHVPWGTRLKTPMGRLPQSRGAIRAADHVVCLSSADAHFVRRRHGLSADRVTWMVNGAPPLEPRAGFPPDPPRVLFVGGWLDVKGRRVLPRLWHAVRQELPQAELTLAGTGASASTVRVDFHVTDRDSLTVHPRIEDPDSMRALRATHHALVLPSVTEGSPLVVLEAMAAGLPIAAAAVGGVPDMLRDRRDALLFSPCDSEAGARALVRVLSDRVLARQLADCSLQRVPHFTWDAVADAFEGIARRLRDPSP